MIVTTTPSIEGKEIRVAADTFMEVESVPRTGEHLDFWDENGDLVDFVVVEVFWQCELDKIQADTPPKCAGWVPIVVIERRIPLHKPS